MRHPPQSDPLLPPLPPSFPINDMDEKSIAFDAVIKESVDLESEVLKFFGFIWNPLSWVMEAAALMAIGIAHGGNNYGSTNLLLMHTSPGITMTLLVSWSCYQINHQLYRGNNAGNVVAALMAGLALKTKEPVGRIYPWICLQAVFTLGDGAICWRSKKQRIIAKSTMEAELIVLPSASQEAGWLHDLLLEMSVGKTSATCLDSL
ncbi:hypothetical protein RJ640_010589 [Escallonia rubra]|uniref:Uncharacterized protein n=1 Tax=Escallonia rubra TaxID=112253 RepID=A0AA88QML6_9ASTE|nr:hypothetical protein RJ640_010589 [Escallonia rubra]